ncbi:hypothetical protein PENTCL1PPCAC_21140, partial [Pristionchus entomophagus]
MGGHRGYRMQVVDGYGRVTFTISRPLQFCKCACCACCECCQRQSKVEGMGMVVSIAFGRIHQLRTGNKNSTNFAIQIIHIDGPCCICCGSTDFPLKSASDGSTVGLIKKKWKGCLRSTFTKGNEFHIEFPADMDVRTKAAIIGACIMIDFEQFENSKHNRHHG